MAEEKKKVVLPVVGETGAGKSNLINALIGLDLLKVGSDSKSITTLEDIKVDERLVVEYDDVQAILLDTAGFLDTQNDDITIDLVKSIVNEVNEVNGFIIVLNNRFKQVAIEQMKIFFGIFFNQIPWDKMIFVKTGVQSADRVNPQFIEKEIKNLREDFEVKANIKINFIMVDLHRDYRSNWPIQVDQLKQFIKPLISNPMKLSALGIAIYQVMIKFGKGIASTIIHSIRGKFEEIGKSWEPFMKWITSEPIKEFIQSIIDPFVGVWDLVKTILS